jgi:hypothetical protein
VQLLESIFDLLTWLDVAKIIFQKANEPRFRCVVGPFLQLDRRQPIGSEVRKKMNIGSH